VTLVRRTFKQEPTAPETAPEAAPEPGGEVSAPTAPDAASPEAASDEMPQDGSVEAGGESAEAVAVETPPAAETPLQRAQAAMASNDADIARLTAERNTLLVCDALDEAGIARIDAELARHQHRQKTLADRLTLLGAEAQREAAEQAAQAREAKIVAAESLFSERLGLAEKLAGHVKAADECFLRLLAANRVIEAAWPWEPTRHAGAVLLGDRPMLMALKNEIYRVAGRPNPLGGQPDHADGPGYPGGHPELLQWAQMPEKSAAPMADKFELASRAASQIMRVGRVVDAVPASPTTGGMPPVAEQSPVMPAVGITGTQSSNVPRITPAMAEILRRQAELAMRDDPVSEAEYLRNGELLREMSA
jgi:hypothetical protein